MRRVCLIIVSATLFISHSFQGIAAPALYGTGVKPPTKEQLEWASKNVTNVKSRSSQAVLPAKHKNIQYLPVVRSQGGIGACASWATTYYVRTWHEAKEHGWVRPDPAVTPERVANPLYTYSVQCGGTDEGSTLLGNLQFMTRHGAATYADRTSLVHLTLPAEEEWKKGAAWRIQSVQSTQLMGSDAGLAALKEKLANGSPAAIALFWSKALAFNYPADGPGIDNEVYYSHTTEAYLASSPSHAVTLIGYDDTKSYVDGDGVTKYGAFLAVNSWGSGWGCYDADAGSGGFVWFSYDLIKNIDYAYTIQDKIGYQPKEFAIFEMSHPMIQELEICVKGGDRKSPRFSVNATDYFPRQLGKPIYGLRMALDLTEETDVLACSSYDLEIMDMQLPMWPDATGWFYHFSVERSDCPEPWVSQDVSPEHPIQTVDVPYSQLGNPNWPNRYSYARAALLEDEGTIAEAPLMITKGSHDWGDYDGDGDLDLIYATGSSTGTDVTILRNDGDEGLRPSGIEVKNICGQAIWADMNNDGRLDIVLSGWEDSWDLPYKVAIYLNQGAGWFIEAPNTMPGFETQELTLADYDADGDLDIALADGNYYYISNVERNQLYLWKNDGKANFTNSGVQLGGGIAGLRRAAWSDFNCDGLQDVAITGTFDNGGVEATELRIYRNTGNGSFKKTTIPIEKAGPVAWIDYDADGYPDLSLVSTTGDNGLNIFRNKEASGFEQVTTGLMSGFWADVSSYAWGDLDNDGLSDLIATCETIDGSSMTTRTRAYKNHGNATFTEMNASLIDMGRGDIQFIDIDDDGDQDVSMLGMFWRSGVSSVPFTPYFRLYKNRAAQQDGLGRPNSAPSTPTGLAFVKDAGNSRSKFTWTDSNDDRTNAKALRYEVKVGNNTDWNNLAVAGEMGLPRQWGRMASSSTTPGFQLVTSALGSLPFCWSVRSIDSSGLVSPWSVPRWEGLPAGTAGANDIQRDGFVDVADLLECIRMTKNLLTPDLARADRNGDGAVNITDQAFISSEILGDAPPELDCMAIAEIGPAGGSVEVTGFRVDVPQGAFAGTTQLRLFKSALDRPFGDDTASPVYRVRGVPRDTTKPLTIRIRPDAPLNPANTPFGAFGSICDGPSATNPRREFVYRSLTLNADGTATFTVPPAAPPDLAPTAAQSSPPQPAGTSGTYEFGFENEEWYTLGERVGTVIGTHCVVTYPPDPSLPISLVDMKAIAESFDESWVGFQTTYGLSPSKRTEWPVLIMVKDYGASSTIVAEADFFRCYDGTIFSGVNYRNNGFISCNFRKLGTEAQRKSMAAAVTHEAFHLYQDLYDPRVGMVRTKGMSPHHWFYEALSVWSEPKFLALVDNIPDPTSYYMDAWVTWGAEVFTGMIAGGGDSKDAQQNHGYGLAPMVSFFADKRGKTLFAKRSLEWISAGNDVLESICYGGDAVRGAKKQAWWKPFLEQLFLNQIPGFEVNMGMLKGWSNKIFDITDTKLDFTKKGSGIGGDLPDLSGALFTTTLQSKPAPDPTVVLSHRLKAQEDISLTTFSNYGKNRALWGRGSKNNHTLKIDVPVAGWFTGQQNSYWMVSALVANPRSVAPYTGHLEKYLLDVAFTWDQTYSYNESAQDQSEHPYLPSFSIVNSLSSKGLTDVDHLAISPYGGWITGSAVGVSPFDVDVSSAVTLSNTTATVGHSDGSWDEIHVDSIDTFRLEYSDDWLDGATKTMTATDGKFTLQLNAESHYLGGSIYAVYNRVKDHYLPGTSVPASTTSESTWWPVGGFALYPTGYAKEDYIKNPALFRPAPTALNSTDDKAAAPTSMQLLQMVDFKRDSLVDADESVPVPPAAEPVQKSIEIDLVKSTQVQPEATEAAQPAAPVIQTVVEKGQWLTVDVKAPLSKPTNGVNGEIRYNPDLITDLQVELGAGAPGFVCRTRKVAEGRLRFLVYDSEGVKALNHSKAILKLKMKAAADIVEDNVMTNVYFTGEAAARLKTSPAGVVSIEHTSPAEDLVFPVIVIRIAEDAAVGGWEKYAD